MKFVVSYIIVLFLVLSCKTKDSEIIGTWVFISDRYIPKYIIFNSDSIYYSHMYLAGWDEGYKIRGNKIKIGYDGYLHRYRDYEINNDTLTFFDDEFDSLTYSYYKVDQFKIDKVIRDHFDVEIPNVKSFIKYRWPGSSNTIVLSLDSNSIPRVLFNSQTIDLDSATYIQFIEDDRIPSLKENLILVDKNIPIYYLNELEKELYKAQYSFLSTFYLTHYDDSLNYVYWPLPRVEFEYPDSLIEKRLPPPPREVNFDNAIILELGENVIKINGKVSSNEELESTLIRGWSSSNNFTILLYLENSMIFETYIKYIVQIKNYFFLLKDKYIEDKYGEKEYTKRQREGTSYSQEIREDVGEKFSLLILELMDTIELMDSYKNLNLIK